MLAVPEKMPAAADPPARLSVKLTRREMSILKLVARGFTNVQIGENLHISKYTVAQHVAMMLRRMGATNRTDLVNRAHAEGILKSGVFVSGPGWSGTKYTFTTLIGGGREAVSGTAWVDQQGLVRRLLTVTTEKGLQTTDKTLLTTDRDITFGDFGAPVRVAAPPASQTKDTSGQPYWGFYF
jgi:DNA-binding CsgD family transcriptional regulator